MYKCSKPRACFVWRLPNDTSNLELEVAKVIKYIEDNIVQITKADMNNVLEQKFGSKVNFNDKTIDEVIDLVKGKFA